MEMTPRLGSSSKQVAPLPWGLPSLTSEELDNNLGAAPLRPCCELGVGTSRTRLELLLCADFILDAERPLGLAKLIYREGIYMKLEGTLSS